MSQSIPYYKGRFRNVHISVGNKNCKRQHTSYKLEMDQNFEPRDYSKSTANQVSMRVTEGREKSSKCNQCAYASYHAGDLRKHMKMHSGEKTNKCNQCNYTSSQASHLRIHLKTHSGEKSNKCNQCDYACSRADNLRTHVKIHSGENSNKCNQCDYASSQASHLRTHLERHSSGKK